jgi:hypothetical protein
MSKITSQKPVSLQVTIRDASANKAVCRTFYAVERPNLPQLMDQVGSALAAKVQEKDAPTAPKPE